MGLRKFSAGQEVVMEDFNSISKAILRNVYDKSFHELLSRRENSFFGDSFEVNFSNSTAVIVKKGLGFQTLEVDSPDIGKVPVFLDADLTVTLQSAHASLPRIDLIIAKSYVIDEITEVRKYKPADGSEVTLEPFVLQQDFSSDITVATGTPNASPAAPAVPDGYIALASVYVTAASGIANAAALTDLRTLMPVGPNTEINTTAFSRLTANSNSKLKTLLLEIDSILPKAVNSFSIANNQVASADVTGLTLDTVSVKSVKIAVEILRQTLASEIRQMGEIVFIYNTKTASWDLIVNLFGSDSGVEFSIVQVGASSVWKVQYTSSNIVGTSYVGTLKHQIKSSF